MTSFILLMAGEGSRLNSDVPKQYINVNGKDLFEYSLTIAAKNENIDSVILVIDPKYEGRVLNTIKNYEYNHKFVIVYGGKTRQESVMNALNYLVNKGYDKVLIHDSARPLITTKLIDDLIENLENYDSVMPVDPISDSIIEVDDDTKLKKYLSRDKILKVQTPQAFKFDIIYKAHEEAYNKSKICFLDDVSILEGKVETKIIEGSKFNFKITDFDDLHMFYQLTKN